MTKPIGFVATISEEEFPKCDVSRNRFLILHSYPAALLVVAFCYGVSVLKIKTNFHEGRWITAAAISMLPIYGVWMLICYCAPAHFHDPTTSVAIIILALMILFIVFIPKMYTINQQMKLEDSKDIFYRSVQLTSRGLQFRRILSFYTFITFSWLVFLSKFSHIFWSKSSFYTWLVFNPATTIDWWIIKPGWYCNLVSKKYCIKMLKWHNEWNVNTKKFDRETRITHVVQEIALFQFEFKSMKSAVVPRKKTTTYLKIL